MGEKGEGFLGFCDMVGASEENEWLGWGEVLF